MQGLLTPQLHLLSMRSQISNPDLQKNSKSLQTTHGSLFTHPKAILVLCKWYYPFPCFWWCIYGPLWCQELLQYALHSLQCSHFQTAVHQAKWACSFEGVFAHMYIHVHQTIITSSKKRIDKFNHLSFKTAVLIIQTNFNNVLNGLNIHWMAYSYQN